MTQTVDQQASPRMYWLHALTPLHVGAGRGVGYIDLPIMREKVTNWPLVPGSAVKGVLADAHGADADARRHAGKEVLKLAFGVADDNDNTTQENAGSLAGCLVFSDARIVCLPVRSLFGTFAWVTSPMVLQCLHRDLTAANLAGQLVAPASSAITGQAIALGAAGSAIREPPSQGDQPPRGNAQRNAPPGRPRTTGSSKVYLEDLDLDVQDTGVGSWAMALASWLFPAKVGNRNTAGQDPFHQAFIDRFAVVSDDVFNFLSESGTEITARVRIDDQRKTVAKGALWYEEALPAEAILGGLVWCDRIRNGSAVTKQTLLDTFCTDTVTLQIGGKATVGRGRARCLFTKAGNASGREG